MALIFDHREDGKPGVHAILIGVGNYPFLKPGPQQYAPAAGLDQLESPLYSIEAFAEWLRAEMNVAATPLRTLRVLGASPTREPLVSISEPSFVNIDKAVRDWYDDVDTHQDNLALFYFCGHGIKVGEVHALLAEDFGQNRHNPFNHALDPDMLANAMRKARANRQIFLIDSCSAPVDLPEDLEPAPQTIISASKNINLANGQHVLLRASEFGTSAFGMTKGPSLFMEAFLESMQGAGMVKIGGKWVIQTEMLKIALNWLVGLKPEGQGQIVGSGGVGLSSPFVFHEISGDPIIPVKVWCDPKDFEAFTVLRVDQVDHCEAGSWPGKVSLVRGSHQFSAVETNIDVVHGDVNDTVHPPYGDVSVPCKGK